MTNYNFENIAGYETEKEELKRLCEIFNNREKYEEKGAKLPKGIIFYGSAGTGKTLFSKVLANVCGLEVIKIDLSDVEDETTICKRINKAFNKASKRKHPTMIFFDEVDKVLPNDAEDYYTDRAKTILAQLLTRIDGMDSTGNIVFVATCNDYDALPETLTRPGRIDKKIGIGDPTYSSRVAILEMYAKQSSCRFELSMEDLAKLCAGFSGAALETLINECILQSDEEGFVSESLIRERILEIKNEDIPRSRSAVDDTITACRNVGIFLVARALNAGHYVLDLNDAVCNDFFHGIISDYDGDYSEYDEDDYDDCDDYYFDNEEEKEEEIEQPSKYYSKGNLTDAITVLMGGYAAEELLFRKVYDNVNYHLSLADDILMSMVKNGMWGLELRYSKYRHEDILPYSSERLEKVNRLFEETLHACYERAKDILAKNEELLKKMIPCLVEKQILQEESCEKLIASWGGIRR